MKKIVWITLSITFLCISCATTASKLTEVSLKSSKSEVVNILKAPESVSLSFIDEEGRAIEVLDYRLYQYDGAIDGLSPYYDIYSLIFVDDSLIKIIKSKENARLTEKAALEIVNIY